MRVAIHSQPDSPRSWPPLHRPRHSLHAHGPPVPSGRGPRLLIRTPLPCSREAESGVDGVTLEPEIIEKPVNIGSALIEDLYFDVPDDVVAEHGRQPRSVHFYRPSHR